MKKIVIATKNPGKIREMMHAFSGLDIQCIPLSDFGDLPDAVEDGETFVENACKKARFYSEKTGMACLADDSGLEVDALGGAPGVYSARFAGWHADDAANNAKLEAELQKLGLQESAAAYRCVLAFVDTDGTCLTTEGRCPGIVRVTARGTGGFGYDDHFYIQAAQTMAEISLEEKGRISHRGEALRKMAKRLGAYLS